MKREYRYLVFKLKDAQKALTDAEYRQLESLAIRVGAHRLDNGKPPPCPSGCGCRGRHLNGYRSCSKRQQITGWTPITTRTESSRPRTGRCTVNVRKNCNGCSPPRRELNHNVIH